MFWWAGWQIKLFTDERMSGSCLRQCACLITRIPLISTDKRMSTSLLYHEFVDLVWSKSRRVKECMFQCGAPLPQKLDGAPATCTRQNQDERINAVTLVRRREKVPLQHRTVQVCEWRLNSLFMLVWWQLCIHTVSFAALYHLLSDCWSI